MPLGLDFLKRMANQIQTIATQLASVTFPASVADNATLHELDHHAHSPQQVRPTGAAGIDVTSAGGAWTLGNFSADIIAANAINLPFDLHWVVVSAESANAQYELVLYYGAADTECARLAFVRSNATNSSSQLRVQTIILPANSRVRAKLMDSAGGSSCAVKLLFHTY